MHPTSSFKYICFSAGLSALSILAAAAFSASQAQEGSESQSLKNPEKKAEAGLKEGSIIQEPLEFSLCPSEASELSNKVDELVNKKFFDKSKLESIWKPSFRQSLPQLSKEKDLISYAEKLNTLLQKLGASHTALLTANDEAFYFMRSLFGSLNQQAPLESSGEKKFAADFCGLVTGGVQAEKNQVRYVLDASPAYAAGVKRGDKIIAVDGQPYTGYAIWHGKAGKACKLSVERNSKRLELSLTPTKQDFLDGYLKASQASARVIEKDGQKIGYVHLWSGGRGAKEILEDALLDKLKNTQALILDLRDGYGAASTDFLDPFFRPPSAYPDMESKTRSQSSRERSYYDKPVAVLVNRGTRSGKELLAYGLKNSKRGTLFGEKTAGYVLGGEYNPLLRSRCILYLAIVDIKLAGVRLEGKGVSPDIFVKDSLSQDDAPMDRALDYLASSLSRGSKNKKVVHRYADQKQSKQ